MRNRTCKGTTLLSAVIVLVLCGLAAGSAAAHGTAPKCSIRGTAGADVIHGTRGPDVICGGGGNDVIYGAAGNDRLYGDAGSDRLFGGSGHDFVDGGPGANFCVTGSGDRAGQGCPGAVRPSVGAAGAQPKGTEPEPQGPPIAPVGGECPASTCAAPLLLPERDEFAPDLDDLTATPDSIDISKGPATVTLGLRIFEETSVKRGSVSIEGPSGAWQTLPIQPFVARANQWNNGNYVEIAVTVPGSTPVGHYSVSEVDLEDGEGYSSSVTGAELQQRIDENRFAGPIGFDVYGGPDI